jgi:hypothetical protein
MLGVGPDGVATTALREVVSVLSDGDCEPTAALAGRRARRTPRSSQLRTVLLCARYSQRSRERSGVPRVAIAAPPVALCGLVHPVGFGEVPRTGLSRAAAASETRMHPFGCGGYQGRPGMGPVPLAARTSRRVVTRVSEQHFTKCICVPLSIQGWSRPRGHAPGALVLASLRVAQRFPSGDANSEAAVLPVGEGWFRAARRSHLGGCAARRSPCRGALAATGRSSHNRRSQARSRRSARTGLRAVCGHFADMRVHAAGCAPDGTPDPRTGVRAIGA